jgi:hypothetical protein
MCVSRQRVAGFSIFQQSIQLVPIVGTGWQRIPCLPNVIGQLLPLSLKLPGVLDDRGQAVCPISTKRAAHRPLDVRHWCGGSCRNVAGHGCCLGCARRQKGCPELACGSRHRSARAGGDSCRRGPAFGSCLRIRCAVDNRRLRIGRVPRRVFWFARHPKPPHCLSTRAASIAYDGGVSPVGDGAVAACWCAPADPRVTVGARSGPCWGALLRSVIKRGKRDPSADGVHDGSREDREPEWDADSGDGYGATIWMRGALPRLKCSPELSRCLI